MEANSTMVGPKQEEEIELELGLSIGGSFKRLEKLNPIKSEAAQFQHTYDPSSSAFDADLRENYQTFASNCLQLESKREIEALGRQEAKKKRQEKQQKKRTFTSAIKNGDCVNSGYEVTHDNMMWLKSPELENKEQDCKKNRVKENGLISNVEMTNVNMNFTVEQNINMNQKIVFNSTMSPVMYPYPALQYVQFANGFQYPCVNVVPCRPTDGAVSGNHHGMVQSAVNRSFRPFQTGPKAGNGCVSDQNSRKAGSNGKGSPMCSSSLVSDYRSSSHEGGASSDTRSHSSHSLPEQCQLHGSQPNDTKVQTECSASSHLRETAQICDGTTNSPTNCSKPKILTNDAQCSPCTNYTTNSIERKISSTNVQSCATKPQEESVIKPQPVSPQNRVSTSENLPPALLKESKREIGKPPKPQTHNQNIPSFPRMPCVSTTGNGPDGKLINGFLYRYTKEEVSIICVCHGTSFSPAEFVQHAGGTDVSQPLKQITVIPSAF